MSIYTDMLNFAIYKRKVTFQDLNKLAANDDYFNSYLGTSKYVGSFTRNLSSATGDVAYSGVGFLPKAVIFGFKSSSADYPYGGVGFSNATANVNVNLFSTNNTVYVSTQCIDLQATNDTHQVAKIKTLDIDGFTLTWTRVGASLAGTGYITYIALR